MSRVNNKYSRVSFATGGIFLTNTVKAADYGDVLKYIDYFMTDKSDDLAYWGSPAWSTGTGVNRKFKPEYKALEDWAVYGKEGGKDGTYYGLGGAATINMADGAHYQFQVKPFAFFQISGFTAPDGTALHLPGERGLGPAGRAQERRHAELGQRLVVQRVRGFEHDLLPHQQGLGLVGLPVGLAGVGRVLGERRQFHAAQASSPGRSTGAAEDFDDNWDLYTTYLKDAGLEKAEAAARATLKAQWDSNILQSIVK